MVLFDPDLYHNPDLDTGAVCMELHILLTKKQPSFPPSAIVNSICQWCGAFNKAKRDK
jgi:hypothetical protein